VLEMCREEGLVRLDHVAILKGRETGTRRSPNCTEGSHRTGTDAGSSCEGAGNWHWPVPKLALRSDTIWHWPNSPNCLACRPPEIARR